MDLKAFRLLITWNVLVILQSQGELTFQRAVLSPRYPVQEPGKFKHQNIIDIILAVLDILQHPLELQVALDVLSGEAFVRILPVNHIMLIFSTFSEFILLDLQK